MAATLFGSAKALLAGKAGMLVVAVLSSGAMVAVVAGQQAAFPADPLTVIEQPRVGQAIVGTTEVSGFSIDRNTTTGTGVAKVVLYLDRVDAAHKLGEATLGLPSAAALAHREGADDERFEDAGWSFTWTGPRLTGNHVLYVVASSSQSSQRSSITSLELNDPLVEITAPEAGDDVSGELIVRGFALDRYSATPTAQPQIDRVEIFLDDELLGLATLGLPSPADVIARFGVPLAGWSFELDLSGLATGEHELRAVAYSAVQDSHNEAVILIVVTDPPDAPGEGCGWLVGRAKGQAIHALQDGWKHFHSAAQAHMSGNGSADKDQRAALRDIVHATRAALHDRRQQAHGELKTLAKEYLALCHAGALPGPVSVTVEQDVVPTDHLLFGYRPIVDQAIADMQTIFEEAEAMMEAALATTEASDKGKGNGNNKGRGHDRAGAP